MQKNSVVGAIILIGSTAFPLTGWRLAFVADFGTLNFNFKNKFDMKNKTSINHENGNDANRLLAVVLIFGRYLAAFGLGMLPIIIGLKSDWYVMPLVVFNFVIQFGLATFQMLPYFKQVSQHYR